MLLLRMCEDAPGPRRMLALAFALGTLFTAYDLMWFFAPAVLLALPRERGVRVFAPVLVGMVVPQLVVLLVLDRVYHAPLVNSNSMIYSRIVSAYLHPGAVGAWLDVLAKLPAAAAASWFFGNFLFLPVLVLGMRALSRAAGPGGPSALLKVEKTFLLTALAIFAFNNLAPPYPGWQMRGVWIPRLYQPLFVVFVGSTCRLVGALEPGGRLARRAVALCALTCLLQASVAYGSAAGNPVAYRLYNAFYQHAPPEAMGRNLARYGRRPLGFCAR
jgi:hypothetical protein